ncbi:TetR family transcriptional regulator [Mesorhizobium yinganensis]|uniref:TetR/AcrR family transcriptional regulator n=1 Tax=Mesorhizobium yinganensis TaxID=3157707 RepID=UPI003CCD7663
MASYDDVGLRDIATDVDVDVAYVHRSFGSKEQLFREVLDTQRVDIGLSAIGEKALAGRLAEILFERAHARTSHEHDPLTILVRSLASPTAGRLVGERLQDEYIEPIQQKIGERTPLRASMTMSLLIGFSILRHHLQLPAVTEIDPAQAEALIASAIDEIMKFGKVENPDQA